MFESDDFDQILSQFELPEDVNTSSLTKSKEVSVPTKFNYNVVNEMQGNIYKKDVNKEEHNITNNPKDIKVNNVANENESPKDIVPLKHIKRKIIHSYFDHKSKRKFPGPAGILTANLEPNKDETICQMELLSQDVDFTQNNLKGDLFESPLWARLLEDLKNLNLKNIDTIKTVKQQAMSGSLRRRKAHAITAFVETIDRSVTDPLIIMRDNSGNIKGTLHRDAWSAFSQYIAAEYCAFILWKPTILTTGAAFKKHYLNITLSNILAVYSSTVLNEESENKPLPDGYSVVYEGDYTVIKMHSDVQKLGAISNVYETDTNDLLDGLDSIFSDDIF